MNTDKQSWSSKTIEKYPHFFYLDEVTNKHYCPCGAWPPVGWESICDMFLAEMEEHRKNCPTFELKIEQIKEKFGELRIYATSNDNVFVNRLLSKFEELASKTCQVTGKPGEKCISKSGWISILDVDYATENGYFD